MVGEGVLLALVPPLSVELYCDDGWSDTSSVGRAGLVGVGCRCLLGHRGSLSLGNMGSASTVASGSKESFTAQSSGLWDRLLPQLRANIPGFLTFVEVTLPALPWEMACKFK